MKKILICSLLLLSAGLIHAQKKTNATTTETATPAKPAPQNVAPTSFENSLVQGRVTLLKAFHASATGAPLPTTYLVACYAEPNLLNNGKPLDITLTQQSFDNVFKSTTGMASRYPALSKYVADNKLNLTDEKGWIAAVKYFNSLK